MRTILVALAVALATGSATSAAFIITSKDIKNGTIQPIDLSPKAKLAMRGPRGRAGPAGPTGPAGLGAIQTVFNYAAIQNNPGVEIQVVAPCPAGKTLTGGGFQASEHTEVLSSLPYQNGWHVSGVYRGSAILAVLYSYALCASSP